MTRNVSPGLSATIDLGGSPFQVYSDLLWVIQLTPGRSSRAAGERIKWTSLLLYPALVINRAFWLVHMQSMPVLARHDSEPRRTRRERFIAAQRSGTIGVHELSETRWPA
jgi:hypothetical protein